MDLLDKLKEENIEYLIVAVQKGKKENSGTAYYNFSTASGTDIIFQTIDKVIDSVTDDEIKGDEDEDDEKKNDSDSDRYDDEDDEDEDDSNE